MITWCDANPAKKKTRRGIDRFINNWLERAQNRGYQQDINIRASQKPANRFKNCEERKYNYDEMIFGDIAKRNSEKKEIPD